MAVGHVNRVARFMGFSYKNMYGHFLKTKKTGHNDKVII